MHLLLSALSQYLAKHPVRFSEIFSQEFKGLLASLHTKSASPVVCALICTRPSTDDGVHVGGCPHVASFTACLFELISECPSVHSLMPVPRTDGGKTG